MCSMNTTPSLPPAARAAPPAEVTPSQEPPLAPGAPRRRWSSQALLGEAREVEIEHGGQLYRLRLTSLGKLILTK